MLLRGGAELSKRLFFCLMQTQNYLGHDLSRAGKNARPAASAGGGAESWSWETAVEFFPALRELLCLKDCAPERVL